MNTASIPASEFPPPGHREIDFSSLIEQSSEASEDGSDLESSGAFPMDEEDTAVMGEEELFTDEETARDDGYMSSPDQPEEKPRSLEEEIGGGLHRLNPPFPARTAKT